MISKRDVVYFIRLQEILIKTFFIAYPGIKDFDFLLDFPKKGTVFVNDEEWSFIKHGKGVRFLIRNDQKERVVDINDNIKKTRIINIWRLSQYFSLSNNDEIKELLDEMVESGILQKISEKQYELI